MSASQRLDADYPWMQEHLRDLITDPTEKAVQEKLEADGQVYPHDIEDPAGCWIELVMACRIQDHNARKQHVLKWNALARGSSWNREMLLNLRQQEEDEPEVTFQNSEEEMDHHQAVKDLLDAADANARKEIAGGLPATPPYDDEPMTEPYTDE